MELASLIHHYYDDFHTKYGSQLLPGHLAAIAAIKRCRTPEAGELFVQCSDCGHTEWRPRSCGHRSCPQCQNHEASVWLDRQQTRLLPVEYFMATFTVPYELRFTAWDHQTLAYKLLFACVSSTLKDFGLNPKNLGADIGMTAILHTHNRRLDYHPHIHVVSKAKISYGSCCNTSYPKAFAGSETMAFCMATPKNCSFNWFCRC